MGGDVEQGALVAAAALHLVAERAARDGWGAPTTWLQVVERRAAERNLAPLLAASRALQRNLGVKVRRNRAVDRKVPDALRSYGVTAREFDVLVRLADLPTNAELAEQLFLSVRTVEKHVASLLMKTGASDRRALARLARDVA